MPRQKKTGAAAVQEAAMGHNSLNDDIKAKYLKRDAEIVDQICKLNEDRKENLREAKDAGMSKMAIRKCTKENRMSDEQREAKAEVEHEAKNYAAIWREVFGEIANQEAA
jgi:hypothetical protein